MTRSIAVLALCTALLAAPARAAELTLYFGNLHAHTSYSDGQLTPAEAFPYARDTGKLDFMAMTDHEEQITDTDWPNTKAAADAANQDGTFVAIAGYEWGSPTYNHLNFFDLDVFYSIDAYLPTTDLGRLWHEVRTTEPPPIMQFNHPDWKPDAPDHNWKQFKYDEGIDSVASLIEVKQPDHELAYNLALDNGWHVSAVFNQDNHDADWGTQNDCRAAFWMTALTRTGLLEAMRAGRSFSTCDKNASVTFKGNGEWMGSIVHAQPVNLTWELSDPDAADTFDKVEVVSNAGAILAATEPKTNTVSGTFDAPAVTGATAWYYLRITMSSGAMIYTAPIYYEELPDAGTPDTGGTAGADAGTAEDVLLTGAEPADSGGCSCSSVGL